jgi:hypothetical protein
MIENGRKARASFANGNCIFVGTVCTSSYSEAGNCAGVGQASAGVGVQDTKQDGVPGRTELEFTPGAWGTFLGRVKGGVSWG